MAKDNQPLTKRQASNINKTNRRVSGNINALMDTLNTMTYGVQRTDKVDKLVDEFNSLMKANVDTLSKSAGGDTTGFLTKLFSESDKRAAQEMRDLEMYMDSNTEQLEAFFTEQYKNRLLKQADLEEIVSQLVELQEAITITRDAIISADIVDGHMTRNLTIANGEEGMENENHIMTLQQMEQKFKLQTRIKNFIIPKSLISGEYYSYTIPYAQIFSNFMKEKNGKGNQQYRAYGESTKGFSLYEFVSKKSGADKKSFMSTITEAVESGPVYSDFKLQNPTTNTKKQIETEAADILKNVVINNNPIPLPILEEGADSLRYYFNNNIYMVMENTDKSQSTFEKAQGFDPGIHPFKDINKKKKPKKDKETDFSNIKDCYMKLIDARHLLPIELMNEVIGYYYIQEEDITPMSGLLTSTTYYNKYDNPNQANGILNAIANTIVEAFDKKFLEKNEKFKDLIVEALTFYKLNNKRVKFQFIPKEYITVFKINEDENDHGTSIIEPSLFYAKLYLMILLFKIYSIVQNSNDTKVNYIRQSGIEKNVINKIQEIARKKQQRQINISDMFTYSTIINKIGMGTEMYVPVGRNNERGIETEILSGQEVQLNSDLLEMLKKAYITGTGVPDVLMNYFNEADFAKTLELANNRFQGRIVSCQLDYSASITELYRKLARYSTDIPEHLIDTIEFSFVQPKSSNANITNDLLNNHNTLTDFIIQIFDDSQDVDPSVLRFKKAFAKNRLPMLNWDEIEKIWKDSKIEGTQDEMNPDKDSGEA